MSNRDHYNRGWERGFYVGAAVAFGTVALLLWVTGALI